MAAKVDLELPFGAVLGHFYCPACGAEVMGEEGFASCPHLLFTYLDLVGEFEAVAPDLADLVQAVRSEEDRDEDPVDALLGHLDSKSILAFSLTTSGMACGPVSATLSLAFDLSRALE